KPANSPAPSVELVATRLGLVDQPDGRGLPAMLLHGSFSNRRFWYSPKGVGLGPYQARAGYDVWIPQMRRHGITAPNQKNRP
ncbi:alpha/beta hydrolase, partial [Pseudomonas syringae pv. tagetis]